MLWVGATSARLLKTPSNLALNASRIGASTTFLGSLCQCLTTLWIKNLLFGEYFHSGFYILFCEAFCKFPAECLQYRYLERPVALSTASFLFIAGCGDNADPPKLLWPTVPRDPCKYCSSRVRAHVSFPHACTFLEKGSRHHLTPHFSCTWQQSLDFSGTRALSQPFSPWLERTFKPQRAPDWHRAGKWPLLCRCWGKRTSHSCWPWRCNPNPMPQSDCRAKEPWAWELAERLCVCFERIKMAGCWRENSLFNCSVEAWLTYSAIGAVCNQGECNWWEKCAAFTECNRCYKVQPAV